MTYLFLFFLLLVHTVLLLIVIYNFISAPRIYNIHNKTGAREKVSILIPMRNEENNIGKLLDSLKSQTYSNYEIIVLDDDSTDGSFKIVEEKRGENSRIALFKGSDLPDNWLGKNWACYQLSKLASCEYLLFIDADVVLRNNALSYSISLVEKYNLSLLSVFPTQTTVTLGERLVVPLMNWLLLTFLPLIQVYKSNNISFSAANGQYILIKKETYEEIGTHKKFKTRVVEDMEIIRSVKDKKKKAMTCLGNGVVFAAMYSSFTDSINGFTKNFFAGFNTSQLNFMFLITFFLILFFLPIILTAWDGIYLIIVGFIIIERALVSILSRESIFYNILLHPFQILIMFIIGLKSLSRKKRTWKGRTV